MIEKPGFETSVLTTVAGFVKGWRRYCIGAAALWVAGCAQTPGSSDIPPGTEFTTQFLADGTKIFVLKLHGMLPESAPRGTMRQQERQPGADCFPCEPGQQRGSANGGVREQRPIELKTIATAMIAENHFCRDGFVVLEQYRQERERVLRGECRDSATAADRERFTH